MSDAQLVTLMVGGGIGMSETDTRQVTGNLYRVEVIANLFGVSVRRIQQLTQDGVISTVKAVEDGRSVRRYDLVPTIQNYVKYLSEKAYGKTARSDKEIELRQQKMEADIALKESQGELHRLRTDIAAGKYISVEEVKLDYAKFFVVFKKFASSIPSRISGSLTGQVDPLEARRIEKEISTEINNLLNSFVVAGVVEPRDVKEIRAHARKALEEKVPGNELPEGSAQTAAAS